MEKKTYESLEISVVLFKAKDVIVASGDEPVALFYYRDNDEMAIFR